MTEYTAQKIRVDLATDDGRIVDGWMMEYPPAPDTPINRPRLPMRIIRDDGSWVLCTAVQQPRYWRAEYRMRSWEMEDVERRTLADSSNWDNAPPWVAAVLSDGG